MAEFDRVQNAQRSPTQCVFCSDFAGPFIDAHFDMIGYGAVYICAPTETRPGCVGQMARLCGFYGTDEFDAVALQLVEATESLREAQRENKELKELDQLVTVFRKRQTRTLKETPKEENAASR